ncbi:MAG: hypothetical protein KTR29_06325 [Rhodothermaceae bacterium]|nr:hypothetical protein [Rhodothermaceae bacterium]
MPTHPKYPKGLYFFHPQAPRTYRRNRWVFVVVMSLIALAISWPIYPYFSGIYPMIGGFPLSFSWIILCLLVSLVALITLYNLDHSVDEDKEKE